MSVSVEFISGLNDNLLLRFCQEKISLSSLTSSQAQVDQMVSGFLAETSDWRSLATIATGSLFYRFGRIGTLALASRAGQAAPLLSAASYGIGLASEVTAFEGMNEILRSRSSSPLVGEDGFWKRWRTSFLSFALLKGTGSATQGQNIFIQHLFSDLAMVGGHQVAASAHLIQAPQGSLADQMLHAEATNLQLGAGLSLLHSAAPALSGWERSLDLSLRPFSETNPTHSFSTERRRGAYAVSNPSAIQADLNGPVPEIDRTQVYMSSNENEGDGRPRLRPTLILSLVPDSEPPPSPREASDPSSPAIDWESHSLIKRLDLAIVETLKTNPDPPSEITRRENLQEVLQAIGRTPPDSNARKYLVELPRHGMAVVFKAMNYFSPPHPVEASHLKPVGTFVLSPEVRALLYETEMRKGYGNDFIGHQNYFHHSLGVTLVSAGSSNALHLSTHAVIRTPPKTFRNPFISVATSRILRISDNAFLDQLRPVLQGVADFLPALGREYPKTPVLQLNLQLWIPFSLTEEPGRLRALLPRAFSTLAAHPNGHPIYRVKVTVHGKGFLRDYSLLRSPDPSVQGGFDLEEPMLPE